jgi:hypothetical protein
MSKAFNGFDGGTFYDADEMRRGAVRWIAFGPAVGGEARPCFRSLCVISDFV